MKKLLLVAMAASLALAAPAFADTIQLTATVDGILVNSTNSADGTLDVSNQAFGVFNLNSLSINSETFLAAPDLLSTNTLNINQSAGGTHQLVIDVKAFGLSGPNAVANLLSSFSVTGLTGGWNAQEQTFINGTLLADTGVFTATSDSAFSNNLALLGSLFNAEAVYTINSVGVGRFNGGIDISVAETPLPGAVWLFGSGLGLIAMAGKRRKKKQQLAWDTSIPKSYLLTA